MTIRPALLALGAAALLLSACGDPDTSAIEISAIGGRPRLTNPNLAPLDPPAAILVESTAQGLLRLDAAGQIEPGLAQRWIVSDDGLRYTFRLRRAVWTDGSKVTAAQVAERLRAAYSKASRNPLKPLLGAIDSIEPMTDEVLEIAILAPRPNFLQLLAQPEMAIARGRGGTGPYMARAEPHGTVLLSLPPVEDSADPVPQPLPVRLRGERAALAVARFGEGDLDLVTGGTLGDLPIARAGGNRDALQFDPVAGLFGLAFARNDGPLADPALRRALAMSVDRANLVAALRVPDLQSRETLLPAGIGELPTPATPDWNASPLPARRSEAAAAVTGTPLTVRIALPQGPGYTLLFAHLRRGWRAIGVDAQRVALNDRSADLRLIDAVAPAELASWYLRNFTCDASAVCDPAADEAMAAARIAPTLAERRIALAEADRLLTEKVAFIPLAAPVRWSLVGPRLTGFRANVFARHNIGELIASGARRP